MQQPHIFWTSVFCNSINLIRSSVQNLMWSCLRIWYTTKLWPLTIMLQESKGQRSRIQYSILHFKCIPNVFLKCKCEGDKIGYCVTTAKLKCISEVDKIGYCVSTGTRFSREMH